MAVLSVHPGNTKATLAQRIAARIVSRFETQKVKPKDRDKLALEAVCGALCALNSLDEQPEGFQGAVTMAVLVADAGYSILEEYARQYRVPGFDYSEN